jgi:hypothetical protein
VTDNARVTVRGVPLQDIDVPSSKRKHANTLNGIGSECPQRDGCMLAVHELLDEMRKEFTKELRETRTEMRALRTVLDSWLGSKGIRNSDSTPAGQRGALDISAGPVKLKGKALTVAIVALLLACTLGTIAGGAYVLGQWGRPTAVVRDSK